MNTFHIHTFGCQMNVHDSDRLTALLKQAGMRPTEDANEADLVIVNTCSVREKAEQKVDSQLGKFRVLKERRAGERIVLAVVGCVAQQRGQRILERMPFIDIVLGPDHLHHLADLASKAENGAAPVSLVGFDVDAPSFLEVEPTEQAGASAFVSISKGCDERCSFCIVPSTRGPERHRPCQEIVAEITSLVERGTLEVTLLGQTVNNYREPSGSLKSDADARSDFASLLREIAAHVPDLKRLRYTSPHPLYFDAPLARAHAELPCLCRHIHMPVQSGSDGVLKRMIRRHTAAEYVDAIRRIQEGCPDLTISTDLIVGFPGETDEDFERTLDLMRAVPFFGVYAFKYSPRPGTPALKLGDDVAEETKASRLARVFELSESLAQAHLSTLVGSKQFVLLDEMSPRGDGGVSGRTSRNEIVHVMPSQRVRIGDGIVPVVIREAYKHSLLAEVDLDACEPSLRQRLRGRLSVVDPRPQ